VLGIEEKGKWKNGRCNIRVKILGNREGRRTKGGEIERRKCGD